MHLWTPSWTQFKMNCFSFKFVCFLPLRSSARSVVTTPPFLTALPVSSMTTVLFSRLQPPYFPGPTAGALPWGLILSLHPKNTSSQVGPDRDTWTHCFSPTLSLGCIPQWPLPHKATPRNTTLSAPAHVWNHGQHSAFYLFLGWVKLPDLWCFSFLIDAAAQLCCARSELANCVFNIASLLLLQPLHLLFLKFNVIGVNPYLKIRFWSQAGEMSALWGGLR